MTVARAIGARLLVIAGMATSVSGLMSLFSPEAPHYREPPTGLVSPRITAMADEWSGEIDFAAPYSALSPWTNDATIVGASAFDPADELWGLPRTNGVEVVAGYCGSCHSLALVMQQRQSADGWNRLLDWMIEKQGMAAPNPGPRGEIIAYLSREFGSE